MFEKTRPQFPAAARNCYSESQAREIGRKLREARLARRLDLATLAESTFTRPSDLEALERGDFDHVTSRIHLPVFLHVYGDHLRLDGKELARPREASTGRPALLPAPEPRERSGGLRRRMATTMLASLLLGAATSVGYYAFHYPGSGTVEAIAEAALPVADPSPPGKTGGTDDLPAAPTSTGVPGPVPAAAAVVEPSTAEVAPVSQAEPSRGRTSAAANELSTPEGLGEPAPDLAAASAGEPPDGGHADMTRPTAATPVDPRSVSPSPDAVKEPVASNEPAPLGAPALPAIVAEPTTVPPARAEAAPPAGGFVIYFFSVRPPARVSGEWRRLTERYPDLASLELRPTRAAAIPDKGTFYTIEAGTFATRVEAQAVCDRLRSRGQSCKILVP